MKLPDLTLESLDLVQGMEKRLRQRRRGANWSLAFAVGAFLVQFVVAALDEKYRQNLAELGKVVLWVLGFDFAQLTQPSFYSSEVIGSIVVVAGVISWLVLRYTSVLISEANECFRYSFFVAAFPAVANTPGTRCTLLDEDRLNLLPYDLTERLNSRIRRLSILEETDKPQKSDENGAGGKPLANGKSLAAHIHIDGFYALREDKDKNWCLQITANVRIGGKDQPSFQTVPVTFKFKRNSTQTPPSYELAPDDYMQLVERVYSRVATEIYRQIEGDIRSKVKLFPTSYLRAVALSREAEDFLRSNTIEAYDHALALYRDALGYFDAIEVKPLTSVLAHFWLIWRREARFIRRKAEVVTGYAKCSIYRRRISALSGRKRNTLFDLPALLDDAVCQLEIVYEHLVPLQHRDQSARHNRAFFTFPRNSWDRTAVLRPLESLFDAQRRALFDTFVVRALTYVDLDATTLAQEDLNRALAIDPATSERDPLYLLTASEIEPAPESMIRLLEKATEIDPEFQIAKFKLAQASNQRFRAQDELAQAKAARIIHAYEEVLRLNPGNIAALVGVGNLHWLLDSPELSVERFTEGLDLKLIVEETFVGELNYGLARLAAEKPGGCFDAYDYYVQAIAGDPSVAALWGGTLSQEQDGCLGDAMMERFEKFKERALNNLKGPQDKPCSEKTKNVVESFILNDYGNACFNYYWRLGLPAYLRRAVTAYKAAIKADPESAVARYNLARAYLGNDEYDEYHDRINEIPGLIDEATSRAPRWSILRTLAARTEVRRLQREASSPIEKIERQLKEAFLKKGRINTKLDEIRNAPDQTIDRAVASQAGAQNIVDASVAKIVQPNVGVDGLRFQATHEDSVKKDPRETLLAELSTVEARIKELEVKKDELILERNNPDQVLDEKVFQRLRDAIGETRLSSALKTSGKWSEWQVDFELLYAMDRRRVDENDVQVLALWAEVMWSLPDPRAWRDAKKLCLLHTAYYPENGDRDFMLREVFNDNTSRGVESRTESSEAKKEEQISDENAAWLKSEQDPIAQRIKKLVPRWLQNDPIHYIGLSWTDLLDDPVAEKYFKIATNSGTPGCYLALGRHYARKNRWEEAADACTSGLQALKIRHPDKHIEHDEVFYSERGDHLRTLLKFGEAADSFRLALTRAPKVPRYHIRLAKALENGGLWSDACAAYRRAYELDPTRYKSDLVLAYNGWGNSLYGQGQYASAANCYRKALEIDPDDAVIHSNHADAIDRFDANAEQLRGAIASLRRAIELVPENQSYRERLAWMERLQQLSRVKTAKRIPTPTPIALDVHEWLLPLVVDDNNQLTKPMIDGIETIRDGIKTKFGIVIPGVRVRPGVGYAPGVFVISLMEIPAATAEVRVDSVYLRTAATNIHAQGLAAEPVADEIRAMEACWAASENEELLKLLGFTPLSPLHYVIDCLQAILERNVAEFTGLQESRALIDEIDRERAEDLSTQVDTASGGLSAFTTVVRALLAEHVPVKPLYPLLQRFLDLTAKKTSLEDIVEQCRRIPEIRSQLPGNESARKLFKLDDKFEDRIRQDIWSKDKVKVLAMVPDNAQRCLQAIREKVGADESGSLIVSDPLIRPHVRKLIESDFSRLAVIALDELTSTPDPQNVSVIALA